MRKGIKTTEFWIVVLSVVGSWTMAIKDLVPPKYVVILTALATSAYAISRGLAKSEDGSLRELKTDQ